MTRLSPWLFSSAGIDNFEIDPADASDCGMSLQFHDAFDDMEIWSASSNGFSFVISHESPSGLGFRGRPGYLASWRPLYGGCGAVRITGSPFKTFAEAERACNIMLGHLNQNEKDADT